VHAGQKAVRISQWGLQDWSFSPQGNVPVKPGQVYQYSAWVRVDSLVQSADISVVLYDAANNALDWAYAAAPCTLSQGAFRYYSTRFLVPDNVAFVHPRIIGNDSCLIFIDDFSLTMTDSVPGRFNHPYRLANSRVMATINPVSFAMGIKNSAGSRTYSSLGVGMFQTQSVDSSADSLVFHCSYVPGTWPMTLAFSLENEALKIQMRADSANAMQQDIQFPGPVASSSRDYIIIPKGTGIIMPAWKPAPYLNRYRWVSFYEWRSCRRVSAGHGRSLVHAPGLRRRHARAAPRPRTRTTPVGREPDLLFRRGNQRVCRHEPMVPSTCRSDGLGKDIRTESGGSAGHRPVAGCGRLLDTGHGLLVSQHIVFSRINGLWSGPGDLFWQLFQQGC
jgi:hypothetical protein